MRFHRRRGGDAATGMDQIGSAVEGRETGAAEFPARSHRDAAGAFDRRLHRLSRSFFANNMQFLMPGPLASAHGAIENCSACHTKSGSGKLSWLHGLVAGDRHADSNCMPRLPQDAGYGLQRAQRVTRCAEAKHRATRKDRDAEHRRRTRHARRARLSRHTTRQRAVSIARPVIRSIRAPSSS